MQDQKQILPTLKAYRFTERELEKMTTLKKLFEENGFMRIERFPEVYYDTFLNFHQLYPTSILQNPESELAISDWGIHPDAFGTYEYGIIDAACRLSAEGVIVLHNDRLEQFCENHNATMDDARLLVLLHHFGHWLCHWPEAYDPSLKGAIFWFSGVNWQHGFELKYFYGVCETMEALAQLIVYWVIKDEPELMRVFNLLMGRNTNVKSPPWDYYEELVDQDIRLVIQKIAELRKHFFLSDKLSIRYLKSSCSAISDFYDTLSKEDFSEMGLDLILRAYTLQFPPEARSNNRDGYFQKVAQASVDFSPAVWDELEKYFKGNQVEDSPRYIFSIIRFLRPPKPENEEKIS